jgi:hypothetical protein
MEMNTLAAQASWSIKVAVVQIASQPGQISANQQHALPFIERAVTEGVQLVILPELFACGYIPNPSIWQYGETLDGPTVTWLRQTAARLGLYLGAGFVEIAGNDLYNSFALATPDYDGWLHPGSRLIRKVLIPLDVALARMSYSLRKGKR